ncbi:SNF5-domain-containing protein [Punctularia strigosozonata HHB-11173 SS5]|uniref:SNF5-domain-containing protein n=1 Tax=Punctularia strigosozonata (strain HHB-11173) TaxID=741275 RepID=UPI0004417207|nr:SNF5-domain-containing protein [Punctularia strigosozonata HHB-11173 SS5]EIN12553.1 SNF5-domain-containing protein [Punctularia strigosozonata HHB-11173 SS5]
MTDAQLRETISQLSRQQQYQATYQQNLQSWSSNPQATPKGAIPSQRSAPRTRALRSGGAAQAPSYTPPPQPAPATTTTAPASTAQYATQYQHQKQPQYPPPPPLPPARQAFSSTYPSRMRTGATLLMQPILSTSVALQAAAASSGRASRRGAAAVSYADPGSGDDIPDAGELDSDDSDFQASGGTRTAIRNAQGGRAARMSTGMGVFHSGTGASRATPQTPVGGAGAQTKSRELDQSYLGQIPPARYIQSKLVPMTDHEYVTQDGLEQQAERPTALVPVRVEFETDTHRVRDCFVWNLHERLVTPDRFARIFCADLDLPEKPWAETIANQIRAQLEDHEGIASMDLGVDDRVDADGREPAEPGEIYPECRVLLEIDVQIGNHHLMDHIEWDLLSPLTPEAFSQKLCAELGLAGEAVPLVAHAVHEEIVKHKKDAIEWGVIGGDDGVDGTQLADATTAANTLANSGRPAGEGRERERRDKSGLSLLKDKTGLGMSWGRAPKDGRGPKVLKSVWRDWQEAEDFATRFEELTAEDIERREIERERASRRLRRETSKFQTSGRRRR